MPLTVSLQNSLPLHFFLSFVVVQLRIRGNEAPQLCQEPKDKNRAKGEISEPAADHSCKSGSSYHSKKEAQMKLKEQDTTSE